MMLQKFKQYLNICNTHNLHHFDWFVGCSAREIKLMLNEYVTIEFIVEE